MNIIFVSNGRFSYQIADIIRYIRDMGSMLTVEIRSDRVWPGLIESGHIRVNPYILESDPTLLLNESKWETQTRLELNGSIHLDPVDSFRILNPFKNTL